MSEEKKYSFAEAELEFAKRTNGKVWQLLGKSDRSPAEDEQMKLAAYASLYHWLQVGKEVNHQRGEWMIAHVYTVLGESAPALKHAQHCLELTEAFMDQMTDFDIAYAYEGMARANALAGNRETARQFFEKAKAAGEAIANPEDKEIFVGDLESGDWYGIQ
jgi:hypothetical protein